MGRASGESLEGELDSSTWSTEQKGASPGRAADQLVRRLPSVDEACLQSSAVCELGMVTQTGRSSQP